MKHLKYIIPSLAILAIAVFGITKAKANPSFFASSSGTATATSSPVSMSAGAATTTEQFDAQVGSLQAMDSASLLVQFTGSSTASIININIERSQDGIDWYSDSLVSSTTAQQINLNPITSYSMSFSSSTVGGVAGNATTNFRIINVPTPTRFVRSVITMPAGSLKGLVWQKFIGKRQTAF